MNSSIESTRSELETLNWRKSIVFSSFEAIKQRFSLFDTPVVNGRISVITVCFNASEKIGAAIGCLRGQDYRDIEYIIVDGQSTDDTVALVSKHQDCIDLAISLKDSGIADAFNRGVALASGEYVAFLNADDLWPSDHLKNGVEVLMRTPTAAFVFGDVIRSDQILNSIYMVKGDLGYANKLNRWPPEFNHPTFITRRSVFQRVGLFDASYKVCMDFDWLIRIDRAGLVGIYDESLWVVMRCGGVSDDSRRMYKDVRNILVAHGVRPSTAFLLWLKATIKTWLRERIRQIFGEKTVKKIRQIINRNVVDGHATVMSTAKRLLQEHATPI